MDLDKPFCHFTRKQYVVQQPPLNQTEETSDSQFEILLVRPSSLGDVLLMTPVIKAIKEKYPKALISVMTMYPECFQGNPYIHGNLKFNKHENILMYRYVYYMAYEWDPEIHIVDAYAKIVGVTVCDKKPDLYLTQNELIKAGEYLTKNLPEKTSKFICIHKESSWESRDWSNQNWDSLIEWIKKTYKDVPILSLGKGKKTLQKDTILINDLDLRTLFAVMFCSEFVVAIDSGLLHCAIALNKPVFSIFGITDPNKRVPKRWESLATQHYDLKYRGIHHRSAIPTEIPPVLNKNELEFVQCYPTWQEVVKKIEAFREYNFKNLFTIVMPTYNDVDMGFKALMSVYSKTTSWNYEVIISDDCSRKDFNAILHQIFNRWNNCVILDHASNFGFTKNVNSVMDLISENSKYFVLLNNDTELITPDWLKTIVDTFIFDPTVGVVGFKLLYPNNRIQHAGIVWDGKGGCHIYKHLDRDFMPANQYRYYRAVTGAVLCIKTEYWKQLGGFCEDFKNSAEDTDLCFRVIEICKQKIAYNPVVEFYHFEGKTLGTEKPFDGENIRTLQTKWPQYVAQDYSHYMLIDDYNQRNPKPVKCFGDLPVQAQKKAWGDLPPVTPGYKIEIGSGFHPQNGFCHYEIIKQAPHLDQLYDLMKPLPIDNGKVKEICANHVTEHVSWRHLPHLLRDWCRVLQKGGVCFIRTPNLQFISGMYQTKSKTPEAKNDEAYIREHFGGEITPTMYANLKLFSGQDYPSNFHSNCMDYETFFACAYRAGFSKCKQGNFPVAFSPGELQIVLIK